MKLRLTLEGEAFDVRLYEEDGWHAEVDGVHWPIEIADGAARVAGRAFHVLIATDREVEVDGRRLSFSIADLQGVAGIPEAAGGLGAIVAPMHGRVEAVHVKVGDLVAAGEVLFVLEAMKMHNEIKAAGHGVVAALHAKAGDAVESGQPILELADNDETAEDEQ